MEDELNTIQYDKVWELIDLLEELNQSVVKWIFETIKILTK